MSPSESDLPVYELFVDSSQLAILADDPWADDYVDASFAYDGAFWPDIEIRYRGNVSRGSSKKNWKIKFPSDELFEDVRKLNLNSEFQDWTMLKNHYGFNLFCWAGIESPHADFAHLELNDEYFGVYVNLEQVDEAYLRHRGHSELDPIYKCVWEAFSVLDDYSTCWEQETDCGWGDLEDIIELVNFTPDNEYAAMLDSAFDVESLLRYYAIIILTSDNDFSRHNLYLHRDIVTGVWRLIPWDHNVAFDNAHSPIDLGTHFSPQTIGGPNIFLTRLIQVDSYRNRFCDLLDSLSTSLYTLSSAIDYVDSVTSYIRTDVYADYRKGSHENNAAWEESATHIAWFVGNRLDYVRPRIDSLRESINRYGVYINEICALNDSGYADEHGDYDDWLELYNSNPYPVELEGRYLSDNIDSLIYWELPDVTIHANGYLVLWTDGEPSEGPLHGPFRLDSDGEFVGLFDTMVGEEPEMWDRHPPGIDLVWFGEQSAGTSWSRYPDGENNWGLADPTPGAPNSPTTIETPLAYMPKNLSIGSIYPNPFNMNCRIELEGVSAETEIEIFDLTGRLVRVLYPADADKLSGIIWDGRDNSGRNLPSGVYLIRASSGKNVTDSKRVVMLK
ncbi:hypothetical protein DRQ36_08620 [bacterium]|nr:MAG: hypothetical protein DRQ36_08620 [bacterium]